MHRDPGTSCCCWQRRSVSSFAVFMRLVCKYLSCILAKKSSNWGHLKLPISASSSRNHKFCAPPSAATQASAQRTASSGRPKCWPYGCYMALPYGAWLWEMWEKTEENAWITVACDMLWLVAYAIICLFSNHTSINLINPRKNPRQQPWRPSLPSWSPASPHEICGKPTRSCRNFAAPSKHPGGPHQRQPLAFSHSAGWYQSRSGPQGLAVWKLPPKMYLLMI